MKTMANNGCGCDGSVRALAASAGIQFGDLQYEAYRLRDELGPDRQKAYNECIRQLARGGAVSETEQRALLELGKRGFAVGSDREFEKFLAYVQSLHKRMLADRNASAVALAIVGAIANCSVPSLTKLGRRGRALVRAAKHPIRNILLGVAGGAFGGLRMSGWNPIGGVVVVSWVALLLPSNHSASIANAWLTRIEADAYSYHLTRPTILFLTQSQL